jgi:hypothetical protein
LTIQRAGKHLHASSVRALLFVPASKIRLPPLAGDPRMRKQGFAPVCLQPAPRKGDIPNGFSYEVVVQ